jgi:plastocyanin
MSAGLLGSAFVLAPAVAVAGDPCYHGYTMPPATTESTSTVQMDLCAFLPTNAEVATGATVTFTNGSGMPHILTGANQAWGDRDAEIAPGQSVTHTFAKAGVYAFACAVHRGMSGSIIVGGGSTSAATVASTTADSGAGSSGAWVFVLVVALAALAMAGWGAALAQRLSARRRITA